MNPLLERLLRELSQASDAEDRSELVARIAALEARGGEFAAARERIDEVRRVFGDGRSGRVTVWLMVAEGLIHHYEKFGPEARDRMSRAQLLSVAMKFNTVASLSSAWLAHIDFESGAYDSMVSAISTSLKYREPTNHDANARVAAVLANAFLICGDNEESLHWFGQAREEATKAGDRSTVEAILYNRAAFLATLARAENCVKEVDAELLHSIRLQMRSSKNFQDLTRFATLPAHVQLWDGRMLMLEKNFSAAIARLTEVRDQARFAEHNFSPRYIDLEIAYCLARLGQHDQGLTKKGDIGIQNFSDFDVDERMVAAWMIREMSAIDARYGAHADGEKEFNAAVQVYKRTMRELSERLNPFRTTASDKAAQ